VGKLVGAWLSLAIVFIIAAILWLRPDITPERFSSAVWKILAVIGLLSAAGFALTQRLAQKWSALIGRLQRFMEARGEFSENELPHFEKLSRAMQITSEHIRQVRERANVESSRRETILAAMAEGVLAVDRDLKVIFCNDAFAKAFGTQSPAGEGKMFYEVVREPLLLRILDSVVRTGAVEKERVQLPSAAGRWFEARALPLGSPPQRGAVVVLHDITDVERQERTRKDFVADVSHELRTPLAAIRGYAETLLNGALEDAGNNRRFVEIILAHTMRLNNIASDLLVLSELDSGATPGPPEAIFLPEVIQSALHTVQSEATLRRVRLRNENSHDCKVAGYRFRLEQALVNLLDNAVKFNHLDGEVAIDSELTYDGRVRVSVRDTGIGIASEDLKRIFERFYRVDKARSRPAGGTGLGLPIVKEVIERMGGTVEVESQLGRGSTFTIVLQTA